MQNIYEAQNANKWKSAIIVIVFALFVAVSIYILSAAFAAYWGYTPGGLGVFGIALILSGLMSFVSYWFSDKIVLGISGARQADKKRDWHFYTAVENLCIGSGMPMPKLYVIQDSAPNAFATGRDPDHAVICATSGLLTKLNKSELEGVVAHELTHIKNYDTRLMSVVAVLVGTVALLADWFLRMSFVGSRDSDSDSGSSMGAILVLLGFIFALLSPIIASLIQLAISRRREFSADSGAVAITRQPQGLISALKIIASNHEPLEAANKATAHLYIENPFKNKTKSKVSMFANLFNTHPPVELRIKALENMS
jgi:heat shock protein HtpX